MLSLLSNKVNEKSKKTHPWEKSTKDSYKDDYKWAHNSINNPQYPVKKESLPNKDRLKFTIIGNRVTKEFIYCTHLVRALHKYRQKIFEAPIIRGVTTIEWPKIRDRLKVQYGSLVYCLESQVAIILNDKFLGGEKELKEVIESRYNYHFTIDYLKSGVENFANFVKISGRPCAYMHISINNEHAGSLIFMLYSDVVPYTCENFLRLCKTRKGGYSGTPIHRIVKDGWIQCGGYGLKSTDLDCENFIIPHDRRGVLCMANDGRHTDCSTQFFVLLQPATWMAHKYVAFGQLIDGESALKAIESSPTFYESPLHNIIIQQAGILNLEYQDIRINKNANEYLQRHIEDLVAFGDLLYEEVIGRVFLEIDLKRIALEEIEKGEAEEVPMEDNIMNIRPTERFIRKKEDIEQLQKSQTLTSKTSSMDILEENNEFDVEVYECEQEESYKPISTGTTSLVVKPVKQFYLPFTDVPYPGEVDSTYNLKKFLRGDYCLESDLVKELPNKKFEAHISFTSEIHKFDEESEISSAGLESATANAAMASLSSEEEQEIRKYIKLNVDRVSFAGGVIRKIARGVGKYDNFEGTRKSELITDEELRRFRLASTDRRLKDAHEKKVSISLPSIKREPNKIKRRPTGFVTPEELEKIYLIQKSSSQDPEPEEDESLTNTRKVRIAQSVKATERESKTPRRDVTESDADVRRKSALSRLYDNIAVDSDEGPTLKDYKPSGRTSHQKTFILTQSPRSRIKDGDSPRDNNYIRHSITIDDSSFEQVLNMQHDKNAARKVSSDYVKTIDQIEHRNENSLRSVEFARTRPSLSVSEYQQKNLKYQEDYKKSSSTINDDRMAE